MPRVISYCNKSFFQTESVKMPCLLCCLCFELDLSYFEQAMETNDHTFEFDGMDVAPQDTSFYLCLLKNGRQIHVQFFSGTIASSTSSGHSPSHGLYSFIFE